MRIRKLIHEKPLFQANLFSVDGTKHHPNAFKMMVDQLVKRSLEAGELGDSLINTVLSWRRISPALSLQLREAINKKLN